jgi:tetratricopeptide (TPR) repeat protein
MRLLTCLLSCLIFAAALHAESETQRLERVLLDPSLVSGDFDSHLATLVEVIGDHPQSEAALVALSRSEALRDEFSTLRPLYELLKMHVDSNFAAFGREAADFAGVYIDLARVYSADLSWHEVVRRWRGITEVHWIGPFGAGFDAAHDDVFPPEVMLDFSGEYAGAYGNIGWKALREDDGLSSSIDLWSNDRWRGAGYYVATILVAADDTVCYLHLDTATSLKVWVGGRYMADIDARRGEFDEVRVPLNLKRGRNPVLVKSASRASFSMSLRDPSGQPLSNVVARFPEPDDPRTAIRHGTPQLTVPPARLAGVEEVLAEGLDDRTTGIRALARFVLLHTENQRWAAGEAAEVALAKLADEPVAQWLLAQAIERNPLFSSSESRRLRREIAESLVASESGMLPAAFERAKQLKEEQRFEDAVLLLEQQRERHGDSWMIALKLSDVYRDAMWRTDEYRELLRAQEMAPKAEPVLRALARHYGANAVLHRRVTMERKILDLRPGDRDAHAALVSTLLRIGDAAGAVGFARAMAAAHPGNSRALRTLAESMAANGQLDRALEIMDQLAQKTSWPEDVYVEAANMCLQEGLDEQAAHYLRRALEEAPGKHFARRQLQRLLGESEDFWSEHELGIEPGLELEVQASDFPHASSALVVDEMVQRIYEDGSSLSFVRQVRKILTQDGVDEWGRDRVNGELVSARTIRPDGTVLEPITQAGGLIEYPGVEVGSYLEIAYLTRTDGNPYGTLDGDRWFFADPDFREPYCISRWVMIAPSSVPFRFAYFNMTLDDDGFEYTEHVDGENIVRIWDMRAPYLPEYEPFMPPALELIPWMECIVEHDWRERARRLASDGLGDTRTTMLIRAKASELTEGLESDLEKFRAIYEWVNETFTTRGDTVNAHQALKAGAGDRRRVFIALCTAAGLDFDFAFADAAPAFKAAEPERLARPRWMYNRDEDFEHFLIVAQTEAGTVFIDMQDRLRPFGKISTRLHFAPTIIWRDGDYILTQLPGGDPEADRFVHDAHVHLAADGSATVTGHLSLHGERSYSMKEFLRTMHGDNRRLMVESEVASHFSGFELERAEFPRLDEVGAPFRQEFSGRVSRLAEAGDDELSLDIPGEKLGRLLSALIGSESRDFDLVLNFNLVQHDTVRVTPPEGYAFAGLPRDLLFPTAPLMFSLQFRMEGRDLVVTRRLALGPGRFTPADYIDLVEQIKRIQDVENTRLRLVKE